MGDDIMGSIQKAGEEQGGSWEWQTRAGRRGIEDALQGFSLRYL